jgi:hypothetical protein
MKTLLLATVAALLAPTWAAAQKLELNFDALAAKAREKAEVDLDGAALKQSLQLLGQNPKDPDAPSPFSGVQGLFVRHYEFAAPGAYSDSDLVSVRKQVASGSGWSRIVNVKEKNESVEIYMLTPAGAKPGGFLLIAAEPKELTVVHVIGPLDVSRLQELVNSRISYDLKTAAGESTK